MTDETGGDAFRRYMNSSLELNDALLEWNRSSGGDEAEPWRRAQAARMTRNAAADEYVGILLRDPFSAKAKYEALTARLRNKCDEATWGKMMDHLQALNETFEAQYPRAWFLAALRRYWPVLIIGMLLVAYAILRTVSWPAGTS